ncbi:RNase H domain-containing protein [Abeliophyllum distichum]|uniref:RNase H domain-containing protein n=1 Tax=Abeliophyllum distichum TaxID=126358 RepID=A0ABD1RCF4_9LAMI
MKQSSLGLGLATQLGVTVLEIRSDSQLVVGQILGEYEAKDARMAAYLMKLYRRGFSMPYQKCLRPTEAADVLFEIHNGLCGNHLGGDSLAFKALRQGYYWPTMKQEAKQLVRKCDACQRFGNIIHHPAEPQSAIYVVCPFYQWGMDILGPLPPAKG